jgi:hypothetical protein
MNQTMRNTIVTLARSGESNARIQKHTGVGRMTICNILLQEYEAGTLPVPNHALTREAVALRKRVRAYADEHKRFYVQDACDALEISAPTLDRHLRSLGMTDRTLPKLPTVTWRKYTDDEMLAAVQEAWAILETRGARYLSVDPYTALRKSNPQWPGANALVSRFGSWSDAMELAGIPVRQVSRRNRWSQEDIEDTMIEFAATGESSMAAYDRWRREKGGDLPGTGAILSLAGSWRAVINWAEHEAAVKGLLV